MHARVRRLRARACACVRPRVCVCIGAVRVAATTCVHSSAADVIRLARPLTRWTTCARSQDLTPRPVKGMLTGPVTILNWSFPRKDISRRAQAFQASLASAPRAAPRAWESLCDGAAVGSPLARMHARPSRQHTPPPSPPARRPQLALALRQEVAALEAAGCLIVQVRPRGWGAIWCVGGNVGRTADSHDALT